MLRLPTTALILGVTTIPAFAADVDYVKQIKPLLKHHCVSCHGPLRQKGGLRLDAARFIRKGGDSGTAVKPGKPADSLLSSVLTGQGGYSRMPKDDKPLKLAEIALISRWIREGAKAPANEPAEPSPSAHWAYRVPRRPKEPRGLQDPWVLNPIDTFLAAEHKKRGLKPQPAAAKHILLRRVYLDLIGRPPTPQELQSFLNDNSPNAYERVVDRLLKSPRYGERWGRHWMDVWRYSDWYGYRAELRNSAKHIWRWRDYIVESLNKDRPYREMIVDMLAADEHTPTDRDRLRATGFLARHYYKFNRDVWLDNAIEHTGKAFLGLTFNCARCHDHKYDPIDHRNYYEFRAIFEPYLVRGDRVPGDGKDALSMAYDAKPQAKTYVYLRGNDKHPDKAKPCLPSLPDFLGNGGFQVRPVKLPGSAWYPGMRHYVRRELLKVAEAEIRKAEQQLRTVGRPSKAVRGSGSRIRKNFAAPNGQQNSHEFCYDGTALEGRPTGAIVAPKPAPLRLRLARAELVAAQAALASLKARIAADDVRYAETQHADAQQLIAAASRAEKMANLHSAEAAVLRAETGGAATPRGKKRAAKRQSKTASLAAARKRLAAAKKALQNDDGKYAPITEVYPQTSTGRRLALAKIIAADKNPLTARVAVNHIWMRHFGQPLVSTTFDFGLNGKPPSHPQLLDWLAVEFMESGWKMKHLHRLIVTSNAYRMSSSTHNADLRNLAADEDNIFLWRMNSRRMEAEIVRDSVLFVAGQLDLTMGGPEPDAKLGLTTNRRSLYYRHAPEKFMSFLQIFDGASTHECYRRNETVVPQQSLAMINSGLLIEQSRRLTGLLNRSVKTDGEFVDQLFLRTLSRTATPDEKRTCLDFLASQSKRLKESRKLSTFVGGSSVKTPPSSDPMIRARENLAQVMLNHNEFITIR